MSELDLLVVSPGAVHGIYGALGDELTAVEPPLWCRLIAAYVRDRGYKVKILDLEAQPLPDVGQKVKELDPALVCIAVYGHQPSASSQQMYGARLVAEDIRAKCDTAIIMCGGHVAALPERTLKEETAIDYVCTGEGPETVHQLLRYLLGEIRSTSCVPGLMWRAADRIHATPPAPSLPMEELHGDCWDLLPMKKYRSHNWQCLDFYSKRQPYASIMTSLDCPFKCLAGDTPVNTIYGQIPIKQLAENFPAGVPVYTFDPKTKRAFISDAIEVRQYGKSELVRVHFDDGTHIDCTPDHQFLPFKWNPNRQWACEAQNLEPGAHVRALRFETHATYNRMYVSWSRRGTKHRSRMIMEYLTGRPLSSKEEVHHVDLDTLNDWPTNLELCSSRTEHMAKHADDFAERMRRDNPVKNMTPEWRAKITAAQTGLRRSKEAIENYRAAAQRRSEDPAYIEKLRKAAIEREAKRKGQKWWTTPDGKSYRSIQPLHVDDVLGRGSFNPHKPVNHKVVSVERLEGLHDVYCLTVPATGWFYANDVLVKNCNFCCISAPFARAHNYRTRDPELVAREIEYLFYEYGVKTFKIIDEMFILNPKHYGAIAHHLIRKSIGDKINIWAYARVDTVKPDTLALLRKAGFKWLALGIESGSQFVRDGASKRFSNSDIIDVVRAIQRADINVIGNYIFGLPDDNMDSMQATLDLALEAKCEWANFYCAMAYPGSQLYDEAVAKNWTLPDSWRGFSQHNRYSRPLDTQYVSAASVLSFRDNAFRTYFSDPSYRVHVDNRFGLEALKNIDLMLEYKLERDLLQAA